MLTLTETMILCPNPVGKNVTMLFNLLKEGNMFWGFSRIHGVLSYHNAQPQIVLRPTAVHAVISTKSEFVW